MSESWVFLSYNSSSYRVHYELLRNRYDTWHPQVFLVRLAEIASVCTVRRVRSVQFRRVLQLRTYWYVAPLDFALLAAHRTSRGLYRIYSTYVQNAYVRTVLCLSEVVEARMRARGPVTDGTERTVRTVR